MSSIESRLKVVKLGSEGNEEGMDSIRTEFDDDVSGVDGSKRSSIFKMMKGKVG